jgi:hypothetical protein
MGIRRSRWSGNQEVQTIELQPVTGQAAASEEDKQFWAATPSGKIELGCLNLDAAEQFKLGATYYVEFSPAKE